MQSARQHDARIIGHADTIPNMTHLFMSCPLLF